MKNVIVLLALCVIGTLVASVVIFRFAFERSVGFDDATPVCEGCRIACAEGGHCCTDVGSGKTDGGMRAGDESQDGPETCRDDDCFALCAMAEALGASGCGRLEGDDVDAVVQELADEFGFDAKKLDETLCRMILSEDANDRKSALVVLSAVRRERTAVELALEDEESAVDGIVAEDDSFESPGELVADGPQDMVEQAGDDAAEREDEPPSEEFDDLSQRTVFAVMTSGLKDEDPSVRAVAFETLMTLPEEERSMLSLQVLGNDDGALKERLIRSLAEDGGESALKVCFHGLDADELAVRELARQTVLELTGHAFATSEDAVSWYESERNQGGEASGEPDEEQGR